MSAPNNGGPAFPRITTGSAYDGMSLRAYIATAALQGLLANPICTTHAPLSYYPNRAIEYADALIAKLNEEAK